MKCSVVASLLVVGLLTFAGSSAAQVSDSPPTPAEANVTGNTSALYAALSNSLRISQGENLGTFQTIGSMEALGYIVGIEDILTSPITQPKFRVCVPANVSADALERVVLKFIDSNPKTYGLPPFGVVTGAFMQAFPCTK